MHCVLQYNEKGDRTYEERQNYYCCYYVFMFCGFLLISMWKKSSIYGR